MPGNNANTRTLFHFDDPPGAPVLDSAAGGSDKIVSAFGATADPAGRWGTWARRCNGTGYLYVHPSADHQLGPYDWTIDCWAKATNPLLPAPWAAYLSGDDCLGITRGVVRGTLFSLGARYRRAGVTLAELAAPETASIPYNTWFHLALCRAWDRLRLFVDGELVAEAAIDPYLLFDLLGWPLYLGRGLILGTPAGYAGWIDEFRIQHHEAWTEAFLPQDGPYAGPFVQRTGGYCQVRQTFTQRAGGRAGTGSAEFSQRAGGVAGVFQTFHERAGGVAAVAGSFTQRAGGRADIVQSRFSQRGAGRCALYAALSQRAAGLANLQDRTFTQGAAGVCGVYADFCQRAGGLADLRTTFTQRSAGWCNVEAADQYELYHGEGVAPDFDGLPAAVSPTLPVVYGPLAPGIRHAFVLRLRDRHGYCSRNTAPSVIELDGDGRQIEPRPSPPLAFAVHPAAGAAVRVTGTYLPLGDNAPASSWLIYVRSDGTDPDPATDPPTEVAMVAADPVVNLDWTSGDLGDGHEIHVLVRTRRTADGRDSPNTQAATVVATASGPASAPPSTAHQRIGGRRRRVDQ